MAEKKVPVKKEIKEEMDLMCECANLRRSLLPYREFVAELERLAEKWLETHKDLPKWW